MNTLTKAGLSAALCITMFTASQVTLSAYAQNAALPSTTASDTGATSATAKMVEDARTQAKNTLSDALSSTSFSDRGGDDNTAQYLIEAVAIGIIADKGEASNNDVIASMIDALPQLPADSGNVYSMNITNAIVPILESIKKGDTSRAKEIATQATTYITAETTEKIPPFPSFTPYIAGSSNTSSSTTTSTTPTSTIGSTEIPDGYVVVSKKFAQDYSPECIYPGDDAAGETTVTPTLPSTTNTSDATTTPDTIKDFAGEVTTDSPALITKTAEGSMFKFNDTVGKAPDGTVGITSTDFATLDITIEGAKLTPKPGSTGAVMVVEETVDGKLVAKYEYTVTSAQSSTPQTSPSATTTPSTTDTATTPAEPSATQASALGLKVPALVLDTSDDVLIRKDCITDIPAEDVTLSNNTSSATPTTNNTGVVDNKDTLIAEVPTRTVNDDSDTVNSDIPGWFGGSYRGSTTNTGVVNKDTENASSGNMQNAPSGNTGTSSNNSQSSGLFTPSGARIIGSGNDQMGYWNGSRYVPYDELVNGGSSSYYTGGKGKKNTADEKKAGPAVDTGGSVKHISWIDRIMQSFS